MPPFVSVVALFVDEPADSIQRILAAEFRIDLLQFHGDEPAAFCEQFQQAVDQGPARAGRPRSGRRVCDALSRRRQRVYCWTAGSRACPAEPAARSTGAWPSASLSAAGNRWQAASTTVNVGQAIARLRSRRRSMSAAGWKAISRVARTQVKIRRFIAAVRTPQTSLTGWNKPMTSDRATERCIRCGTRCPGALRSPTAASTSPKP